MHVLLIMLCNTLTKVVERGAGKHNDPDRKGNNSYILWRPIRNYLRNFCGELLHSTNMRILCICHAVITGTNNYLRLSSHRHNEAHFFTSCESHLCAQRHTVRRKMPRPPTYPRRITIVFLINRTHSGW